MRTHWKWIFVLLGLCSQAQAGALLLDSRMDYTAYDTNDAVGKPGYENFQISRLRLDYQGNLGELNTFRARFDLLQNADTTTKRDRTSKYVDFAYLTRKLGDRLNFTMGKIITGMGGTEGVDNPGDIYLRSTAGNEVAAVYWPVGAQLEGKFAGQTLRLNAANNTEDIYDDTQKQNLTQTGNLLGLTYIGSAANGILVPNVSYHAEKFVSTAKVEKNNSYFAAGTRAKLAPFEIEADFLQDVYGRDPQAASNVLQTNSAVTLVRYYLTDLGSVHVKYEDTYQKIATGASTDGSATLTGWTLAFEYKPVVDENWRMHVAVTKKDSHPNQGDTQTETTTFVGMRLLADFLK